MPNITNLFSYNKKRCHVYSTFLKSYLELKDNKNIELNLSKIYECLFSELSKDSNYMCLEYFINHDLFNSILQISKLNESHNENLYLFFEQILKIFPVEAFSNENFIKGVDLLFCVSNPLLLPISLVLCERLDLNNEICIFYVKDKTFFVDHIFEFLFMQGKQGEISKKAAFHLFNIRNNIFIDYFIKNEIFEKIIKGINYKYTKLNYKYKKEDIDNFKVYLLLLNIILKRLENECQLKKKLKKLEFIGIENIETHLLYLNDILKDNNIFINEIVIEKLLLSKQTKEFCTDLRSKKCYTDFLIHNLTQRSGLFFKYFVINKNDYSSAKEINCFIEKIDVSNFVYEFTELQEINQTMQNDNQIICKMNNNVDLSSKNIIKLLLENGLYDYRLFATIYLLSKNMFFYTFNDLKINLCNTEIEIFKLWLIFSN